MRLNGLSCLPGVESGSGKDLRSVFKLPGVTPPPKRAAFAIACYCLFTTTYKPLHANKLYYYPVPMADVAEGVFRAVCEGFSKPGGRDDVSWSPPLGARTPGVSKACFLTAGDGATEAEGVESMPSLGRFMPTPPCKDLVCRLQNMLVHPLMDLMKEDELPIIELLIILNRPGYL